MIKDVAIIGAGPVGLFAVFQCGMLGMRAHVIDSLQEIGGQCTALYPEKPIYDIPALPKISGADLIENLESQAAPFAPEYHLNQQVTALHKNEEGWVLKTSSQADITAKSIIIAGGVGVFGPNRPPLEGLEQYEGKSVFYMVRRPEEFRDKRVVIAGGGDSAVDWALALSDVAAHVSIVHRRDKFRAAPESVARLRALADERRIDLVVPAQLSSMSGENGILRSISVLQDGAECEIETDILLPFFGLASALGPIYDWGLSIDKNTITVDPSTCETNISGIFAIGDIAHYPNKLKLILTGFADAAHAAHEIYRQLHPDTPLHFVHSTDKGIPV